MKLELNVSTELREVLDELGLAFGSTEAAIESLVGQFLNYVMDVRLCFGTDAEGTDLFKLCAAIYKANRGVEGYQLVEQRPPFHFEPENDMPAEQLQHAKAVALRRHEESPLMIIAVDTPSGRLNCHNFKTGKGL